MQAQVPLNPYIGLWSRLERLRARRARPAAGRPRRSCASSSMRATLHLVTADDCLLLRPLMQPVLDAELARHRDHGPALAGVDLAPGARRSPGRSLAERPTHGHRAAAPRSPRASPSSTRPRSPTPAGTCSRSSRCRRAACGAAPLRSRRPRPRRGSAGRWSSDPSIDDVVLRYLGAFGPATVGRRVVVVAADRDARGGRAAPPAAARRSATSAAASCSTCPTHRGPIPTRRRRRGSSPSTTTCCCPTPTAPASCATTAAGSRGPPAPSRAPCSHDGTIAGTWHIERDRGDGHGDARGRPRPARPHERGRRSPPKDDASSASTSRMPPSHDVRRVNHDEDADVTGMIRTAPIRSSPRSSAISRGRRRRLPTSLVCGNGSRPANRGIGRPHCMSPPRR